MTHTANLHIPKASQTMCGKKILGLRGPNSNSVLNQYVEARKLIGKQSGLSLRKAMSKKSPQAYEYRVIGHSGPLPLTMLIPSLLNAVAMYSGVKLSPVNPEEHGLKREWMLTLNCPQQSFGADIDVRNMLSSMNLEGKLESVICSDGSTVIQSTWKSRDLLPLSSPKRFGSHPISPLKSGTPDSTPTPSPR